MSEDREGSSMLNYSIKVVRAGRGEETRLHYCVGAANATRHKHTPGGPVRPARAGPQGGSISGWLYTEIILHGCVGAANATRHTHTQGPSEASKSKPARG